MAKISMILILVVQTATSFAQNYFVFIGSEDRQPFYVRVDSDFHSSTPEGHLILAQLKDGIYNITVGFPGQTMPEQHYTFNIGGKDQAFQLQPEGSEGLRLYDLQGKDWLAMKGGGGMDDELRTAGVKKDDAFSRMMAGVVSDTAVLYNTYAMEQALRDSPITTLTTRPDSAVAVAVTHPDTATIKPDTATTSLLTKTDTITAITRPDTTSSSLLTKTDTTTATPLYRPIPAKDSSIANSSNSAKDTGTSTPSVPIPSAVGQPLYRPAAAVTKVSERRSSRNVRLVYADHSGGEKTDTIVVIIPVDSPVARKNKPHASDSTHVPVTRPHGPNPDSPRIMASTNRPVVPVNPAPTESPRPHPADTTRKPTKSAMPFVNSDCHDFATDFDADKLRAKMLEAGKDEDRINMARKAFKVKCFHTNQVRTLSEVFTSEGAKYRFLEAAWPFAADEHFHELIDLLADPVYSNKFKTMTHMQ